MSATDLFVVGAGIAAIAWVNWYFFVAGHSERRTRPGTSDGERPGGNSVP